jgi:hypothetical protein
MTTYRITWSDGDGPAFAFNVEAESQGEAVEVFENEIENLYDDATMISIKEVIEL